MPISRPILRIPPLSLDSSRSRSSQVRLGEALSSIERASVEVDAWGSVYVPECATYSNFTDDVLKNWKKTISYQDRMGGHLLRPTCPLEMPNFVALRLPNLPIENAHGPAQVGMAFVIPNNHLITCDGDSITGDSFLIHVPHDHDDHAKLPMVPTPIFTHFMQSPTTRPILRAGAFLSCWDEGFGLEKCRVAALPEVAPGRRLEYPTTDSVQTTESSREGSSTRTVYGGSECRFGEPIGLGEGERVYQESAPTIEVHAAAAVQDEYDPAEGTRGRWTPPYRVDSPGQPLRGES